MRLSKHVAWSTLIAVTGAMVMLFAAQGAMAAIGSVVGSKHDFSSTGNPAYQTTGQTQVCIFCHAPHNNNNAAGSLLWNHNPTTAPTYTVYTNSTLNATTGQPGTVSKLCLSCHDGTVAVDSFGGATGSKLVTGSPLMGTDLSNDHPIGFLYNTALSGTDGGLKDPSSASVTIGTGNTGTIAAKMLFAGNVECASCHDVHNSTGGTAVEAKLVRITTASSALCIACHNK